MQGTNLWSHESIAAFGYFVVMKRLSRIWFLAIPLSLWGLACGGDKDDGDGGGAGDDDGDGGGDDGGDGGDDGDDGTDDGGDGSDDGGTGDDGGDGGDDGGDGGDGGSTELARGIQIDQVEVNQGVQIFIGENGQPLAPAQYDNPVIGGRLALIRAYWQLDAGFEPREIKGVLAITQPGGTPEEGYHTVMVDGPPTAAEFDSTFSWMIPGEMIQEGTTYSITLYETSDDAAVGPDPNPPPRFPQTGDADLGALDENLTMRILFVPMRYVYGGKNEEPDLSDASLKILTDTFFAQKPIVNLEVDYHSTVDWNQPNTDNAFASILSYLSNLRAQENAPSNVYYHGLLALGCGVVGCGQAGTAGIANMNSMVAVSVWHDPDRSAATVVHEIGHNQGLSHVDCPNADAAGIDPSYPHAEGKIGVWGFDVATMSRLYNPNASYDYMSYCTPTWVSDWTWDKTYRQVKQMGSVGEHIPRSRLMHGLLYPDGSEDWWIQDDWVYPGWPSPSAEHVVELYDDGELLFAGQVIERRLPRMDARWLTVVLPDELASPDQIVRTQAGVPDMVDMTRFDRFRHLAEVTAD
jgi:hypothetical protein